MRLHICLLGQPRFLLKDAPYKILVRPYILPLLYYLLLHRASPLARARLAFVLRSDKPEAQARAELRRQLHELKRALPPAPPERPWILSDTRSIQWNPLADFVLDVAEFERLSALPAHLADAVALYTGDLLENLYDDWVLYERERLRALYAADLHQLVAQARAQDDLITALAYAQRLLRHDPLREETHRLLMQLHAANGDRASMVTTYNTCTAVLERELNIAPSDETQQLYQQLLTQASASRIESPVETTTRAASHRNLPIQLSPLIGRERELAELLALLGKHRLVTLTGIGGVGKTRLAIEVASQFPMPTDGIWFVDLSPLADPQLVPQTVAVVLGVREQARPILPALSSHVRDKELLLLLDNCEHLITAVAALVESLLHAAPALKILATSSEPLGISGETIFQLAPLAVPPESTSALALQTQTAKGDDSRDSASVRLFVERALAALPTFQRTPSNARAIAHICRALDGLPLALELAAARVRLMSPEQIAARLDDRFHVLTTSSHTGLPRHQTLRAMLDWSYELLAEPERVLFRRLSIFASGFSLEAAEAVCALPPLARADILQVLSQLVDKSLVMVTTREQSGQVWYRLLETVRQYAREKLAQSAIEGSVGHGDAPQLFAQHLAFFTNLAERAGPHLLSGIDPSRWLEEIGAEHDNLRTALRHAQHIGDLASMARMTGALWTFWWLYGYVAEGREWCERILASDVTLAPLLRAQVLHAAGRLAVLAGDLERALAVLQENLQLRRALNDNAGLAEALNSLAIVVLQRGDLERAAQLWHECKGIYEQLNDKWGIARALNNLGDLEVYRGRYDTAVELLQASLSRFHDLASPFGESVALINLGRAAFLRGDLKRARACFVTSLRTKRTLADKEGMTWTLEGIAAIAAARGQMGRAARLFGAADTLRASIGVPRSTRDEPLYERMANPARAALGPAQWERYYQQGRALVLEQAIESALNEA